MNVTDKSMYIPIIIGISGHREIDNNHIQPLRKKISEVFLKIKKENPHSPIKLLTPLAEGADRIVAKIAIEFGIEIIVPLPMPLKEYLKDFSDDDSRKEFKNLFELATSHFELSEIINDYKFLDWEKQESREIGYYQTGLYIVKNCQILLALWDGKETNAVGGTSNIIKLKLDGAYEDYNKQGSTFSQKECGPVYHIFAPRSGDPIINDAFSSTKIYYPSFWKDESKAIEFYYKILNSIDSFNRATFKFISNRNKNQKSSKIGNIETYASIDFEKSLLNRFQIADILARQFKSYRTISLKLLLLMIIIGLFFFHIYLSIKPTIFILSMYPLLLGVASSIYLFAKKKGFETKHEDYRALSEALRVQLFWNLNGISKNVSDCFLQNHKGDLEWIKFALRNWTKPEFYGSNTKMQNKKEEKIIIEHHRLTLKFWVDDQKDWYYNQGNLNHHKYKTLEMIANAFFSFGIMVALLLIVFEMNKYLILNTNTIYLLHHLLILLIGLSLSCSAAFHGFSEKMVYAEQSKQYLRMFNLLNFASDKMHILIKKNDLSELNKNFVELGTEILDENSDWLFIHRSRPLEFPKS